MARRPIDKNKIQVKLNPRLVNITDQIKDTAHLKTDSAVVQYAIKMWTEALTAEQFDSPDQIKQYVSHYLNLVYGLNGEPQRRVVYFKAETFAYVEVIGTFLKRFDLPRLRLVEKARVGGATHYNYQLIVTLALERCADKLGIEAS